MANPRQRRKSRSGTGKVKHSKASIKNKHKVIIKGPAVLVENYDRKKTVRQNYALLGLMATLNPRQAGGIVPIEPTPFAISQRTPHEAEDLLLSDSGSEDEEDDEDEEEPERINVKPESSSIKRKLGKGEGRIERDPITGKVLRVVMGGEDGEEIEQEIFERSKRQKVEGEESSEDEDESDDDDDDEEEEEVLESSTNGKQTPWGELMEVWDGEESDYDENELEVEIGLVGPRSVGQGIPIGAKRRKVIAKTDVVRQLETLAATQGRVIRHTSALESDWLMSLVELYGEDLDKMARDRKANVWQKTSGEIKRAITKAGGFSKLKAKIIRRNEEAKLSAEMEV